MDDSKPVLNPVDFLLNRSDKDKKTQVVEAPAFSLTKVLTVATPVITAVAALLARQVEDVKFSAGNITVMIIGVIGLVTIAGSADMIARSLATKAAPAPAETPAAGEPAQIVRLATPVKAIKARPGKDENVTAAALSVENPPRFLCLHADSSLTWEKEEDLTLLGAVVVGAGGNGHAG